ncbi:HAD superfamily hydrolase (TIGR01509 family) [Bradyrhizobium macuxiense]|uniref:HAD superfamily hydrolase (TIGR01509 family) n=1 Tax=Bradyrhizobium macuxiense TaxID=1755647 RepID=A0A560LS06_9BRAD|nr:HAD-IA family hydrolase [Bradyrhizobium macuxiense]TWB98247.1 HAD superfamily hydrolase (TIGR01509 family) [Bradyrhizobium macuxiense]
MSQTRGQASQTHGASQTQGALLFDIDGTLADTDPLHLAAFNQVLGPHGHAFDRARFGRELQGFSNASIGERFLAHEPPERRAAILSEKERIFRELVSGQIVPVPGLMALLDRADRAGVPMVAVTNAPRPNAELLLSGLGIAQRFKALVIGDELAHGKPHPLPYLEGLRLAGAAASASLAFEDSRSGVQSATAAGIATIGMRTGLNHADLLAAGAVASARAFDDPELIRLVASAMTW